MMSAPYAQTVSPIVSFVIAVYNEADTADLVCRELSEKLANFGQHEVVFVDDGSSDNTAALLHAWCARMPHWRVLQHSQRSAKSAALRTGALYARGEWIATMDGDGQNDPADMAALVTVGIQSGRDVLVAGCRQRRRDTIWKRLASRFANHFRRAVLNDVCPDTGCGLKAFRRDDFLELPLFEGMHRFLPALYIMYGREIICHPVHDRPRAAGRSKYTNFGRAVVGIFDLMGVVWLRSRTRRPGVTEMAIVETPATEIYYS